MATSWTDHPMGEGTPAGPHHINEIRAAIEGAEGQNIWSDGARLPASAAVRADHLVELRTALQGLWFVNRFVALPNWGSLGTFLTGLTVNAANINDLRRWINSIESRRYGVYSQVYYPDTNAFITPNWADDVIQLGTPNVRVQINSRPIDDDIEAVLPIYLSLCRHYRNRGIRPIAVLTRETLRLGDPKEALNLANTNSYIETFARRSARIAQFLRGVVDHFEIWNEPNTWDWTGCPNLPSQHFGSLLYYAAQYVKRDPGVNPGAHIISGGLLYLDVLENGWDRVYLEGGIDGACPEVGLYNSAGAVYWHTVNPGDGTFPWDHLGVHPYHALVGGQASLALDATRAAQIAHGDPADIWVTEFGERMDGDQAAQADALDGWYDLVLSKPYVGAAFWQKHEAYQDQGTWGLTEYFSNPDGSLMIDPSQRWRAWDRLQRRTGGF